MLQAAVDYAWESGAVLVAATGNDGSSAANFPAGDRGVIGVSNTDQSDALDGSSNYGQDMFLGAPGTGILTTVAGGGYATITGTSAVGGRGRRRGRAGQGELGRLERRHRVAAGEERRAGRGRGADRQRRLNLDRAVADTSTDSIQPAGAAPVGGGGPSSGPTWLRRTNFTG